MNAYFQHLGKPTLRARMRFWLSLPENRGRWFNSADIGDAVDEPAEQPINRVLRTDTVIEPHPENRPLRNQATGRNRFRIRKEERS